MDSFIDRMSKLWNVEVKESAIDFTFKTKLTFSSDMSYVIWTKQDSHNHNICKGRWSAF